MKNPGILKSRAKSLTHSILCLSVVAASQMAFSQEVEEHGGFLNRVKSVFREDSRTQAPRPVIVNQMRRDGFCLTLEAGQDFYPLYDRASLSAETYKIDTQFPDITITLNGLAPDALIAARAATGDASQWPIVFHGPMRLCQIVNFSFYSFNANFIPNRTDRLEVGPNVGLHGIQALSVESSQLKNLDVESRCVPNQRAPFEGKNPCVRLTYDLRSNQDSMLYIRHLGRNTCAIQNKNLTRVESRVEPNARTPMSCEDADQYASRIEAAPRTSGPIIIERNPRGGVIVNRAEDCGPYVIPVRILSIDPNYGLGSEQQEEPQKPSAPHRRTHNK